MNGFLCRTVCKAHTLNAVIGGIVSVDLLAQRVCFPQNILDSACRYGNRSSARCCNQAHGAGTRIGTLRLIEPEIVQFLCSRLALLTDFLLILK